MMTAQDVGTKLNDEQFKRLFQKVMLQYDQEFSVIDVNKTANPKQSLVLIRLRNGAQKVVVV